MFRRLPTLTDAGVYYMQDFIVNLFAVDSPDGWVLVDCGVSPSSARLLRALERSLGESDAPAAIVLTHGHFDHVNPLRGLLRHWPDVLVYAHEAELPYLTGQADYPPPDPTVGGGMMALMAPLYPRHGMDVRGRVYPLPSDGTVPHLPDWRSLHTPGHTPGHISLWHATDRILIAGDAFTTVKQESARAVMAQRRELHGPPAYFTTDWVAAHDSVSRLAQLEPEVAMTGHGLPMQGPALRDGLFDLAERFRATQVPRHGRYVGQMGLEVDQAQATPGQAAHDRLWIAAGLVGAAVIGAAAAGAMLSGRARRGRVTQGIGRTQAERPLESDEVELKSMSLEGRYTGA